MDRGQSDMRGIILRRGGERAGSDKIFRQRVGFLHNLKPREISDDTDTARGCLPVSSFCLLF